MLGIMLPLIISPASGPLRRPVVVITVSIVDVISVRVIYEIVVVVDCDVVI